MEYSNNPIAEFLQCYYKDGFGFDVSVILDKDNTFKVESRGLLKDTYNTFEEFIDDLIINNPNWYTYYYVRIDASYRGIIETKLNQTFDRIIASLNQSMFCSEQNWCIEGKPVGYFTHSLIKEKFGKQSAFAESLDSLPDK